LAASAQKRGSFRARAIVRIRLLKNKRSDFSSFQSSSLCFLLKTKNCVDSRNFNRLFLMVTDIGYRKKGKG
jgi:hypothetical protein